MVKANEFGFSGEVYLDVLPEGRKAIGTHSGSFHSDETLSVSLLRTLPEYRDHGSCCWVAMNASDREDSKHGHSEQVRYCG